MRFHYRGKYSGKEETLPQRSMPGAVSFKEPSMNRLALAANLGGMCLTVLLFIPYILLGKDYIQGLTWISAFVAILFLVPHEFLHGICFQKDVYMYSSLDKGMLFVVGTEDMSKVRFIFMSLLPNIVLGVVPYTAFLLDPKLTALGLFGLVCIGMGFGDYINIFNASVQMPKGSVTFMSGAHSYWYMPKKQRTL